MLKTARNSALISAACVCVAGCGSADTGENSSPDATATTEGSPAATLGGASGGVATGDITTDGTIATGGALAAGGSPSASGGAPSSSGGSGSTGGLPGTGGVIIGSSCDGEPGPVLVPDYDDADGGTVNSGYVDMVRPATDYSLAESKSLESLPGAPTTIYLAAASYYVYKSEPQHIAQVLRIWRHVAEAMRPFNTNVTTSQAAYNAAGQANSLFFSFSIHTGGGGSCTTTHFGKGQSNSGHTCQAGPEYYSVIHEIGHGLGINHHVPPYDNILGGGIKYISVHTSQSDNGAYFAHWVKSTDEKDIYADDLEIISDKLGFRPDDHAGDQGNATPLVIESGSVRPQVNNGVIGQDGEVDMFSFTTAGGDIDLDIRPLRFYNSLHAKVDLLDSAGEVVVNGTPLYHYDYDTWPTDEWPAIDPEEKTENVKHGAKIRDCLEAGTYYLRVTNTGYTDGQGDGYTSYDSLGYYDMKGIVQ